MSKYVKGPWIMEPTSAGDKEIYINAHGDGWHRLECTVSRDDCDDETAEACARLIVAAPDLLEALEISLGFVAAWSGAYAAQHELPGMNPHPRHQEVIDMALTAISKAKGSTA